MPDAPPVANDRAPSRRADDPVAPDDDPVAADAPAVANDPVAPYPPLAAVDGHAVGDILTTGAPGVAQDLDGTSEGLDRTSEDLDGVLASQDVPDADLQRLADEALATLTGVPRTGNPEQLAPSLPAPAPSPSVGPAPAAPVVDNGWDPMALLAPTPKTAATPEAGAALGAPTTSTGLAPAYSPSADGPLSGPPLTGLPGALAASGSAPRRQGTPDLGIFSPLAGTVPAGGLLAWAGRLRPRLKKGHGRPRCCRAPRPWERPRHWHRHR